MIPHSSSGHYNRQLYSSAGCLESGQCNEDTQSREGREAQAGESLLVLGCQAFISSHFPELARFSRQRCLPHKPDSRGSIPGTYVNVKGKN